jgi:hypothetical protein
VFGGTRVFSFTIAAAIVNGDGKTIAANTIALNSAAMAFSSGDSRLAAPAGTSGIIRFDKVKADDIIDPLSIRITRVNNMDAQSAGQKGYMRILTQTQHYNLPENIATREAEAEAWGQRMEAEAEVRRQREEAEAEARRQRAEARQTEIARSYTIKNGEITYYNGPSGPISIPSIINGQRVTRIGISAFSSNTLSSVTIGAHVQLSSHSSAGTFGDFAFAYKSNGKKAGTYIKGKGSGGKWSFKPQ